METEPREVVLVVDDSPEMIDLVGFHLEAEGFRVLGASDAPSALQRFDQEHPDFVMLDLGLPGMSGEELFHQLQRRAPGFPCAFLTADSSIEKAVKLMREGALDYLTKPIQKEQFRARVAALRERLRLKRELESLRALVEPQDLGPKVILGTERAMLDVYQRLTRVARTEAPVLIHGESGTGKEVCARVLHHASRRAQGPFIAVNCAAISPALWESHFFGHVKGAFTDARTDAVGVAAAARGGTLFLDEVGEIPPPAQAKLLRFLQEHTFTPVGSSKEQQSDARIVSATNRDLTKAIQRGEFREDLYYRLNVVPVRVPPLRERKGDIPLFAQHFLERYAAEFKLDVRAFTPSALARLTQSDWPGNIRELQNLVQQVVAVSTRSVVTLADLPFDEKEQEVPSDKDGIVPLVSSRRCAMDAFEKTYLARVLEICDGNISHAATRSGVPRKTFVRMLRRHNIVAMRDGVAGKRGRPRRA